jgi:hypothetical protein
VICLKRADLRLGRLDLRGHGVDGRGRATDLSAEPKQRHLHRDDSQQRRRDDRDPGPAAHQALEPGMVDQPK